MKNVKQRSVLSNKRATCSFPLEWVANMIKKVRENKKNVSGRFVNLTLSYQMGMQSHERKQFICERKRVNTS